MTTHVHFIGIGGVSMHGIALWYHHEGYRVSGCDAQDGPVLELLRSHGIAAARFVALVLPAGVLVAGMSTLGSDPAAVFSSHPLSLL